MRFVAMLRQWITERTSPRARLLELARWEQEIRADERRRTIRQENTGSGASAPRSVP